MNSSRRNLLFTVAWVSVTLTLVCAQTGGQATGNSTIVGRIVNLDTGEYVRNALVRIEDTGKSAISEEGGYYRLTNVPAGDVKLTVIYTGYPTVSRDVNLAPNSTATRDFELTNNEARIGEDGTIKLGAFVVSSDRLGESKAIMQQRTSQDITNVVSSETFGDNASGNIAEFLQNVPGVELDIDRGEATTVRLRGLPSDYTSVTLDGVSLASTDAAAVSPSRALNFQNFSLDSIDAIEVSKTVSADVDANAPAGTINLRPKRAFDLAGRRIVIETHVNAHADQFTLRRTAGPTDSPSRKILPGGKLSYSDVVMEGRLGFNLTLSADKRFSDHMEVRHAYNYTPTAADPRPIVPTEIRFAHTPRRDYRDTVSISADFKANPNLILSMAAVYNTTELATWQREIIFGLGARGSIVGGDPMTSFSTTTASNANVRSSPTAILKRSQSVSLLPKFEFRKDDLRIEGKFAASDSMSWYDPLNRAGAARDMLGGATPTVSAVTYTGTRSSAMTGDWKIVQTGGRDWADGANFTTGSPRFKDGRTGDAFSYSGEATASLATNTLLPIVWKSGIKRQGQDYKFKNETALGTYSLNDAPTTGGWASYRSRFEYESAGSGLNATMTSLSGGKIWVPDLERIGALMRDQPGSFTNVLSAANYFTAMIENTRELEETIDAAFLMATATWGKATIRAGMRWEDTTTDVLEFDPLSAAETRAAGYAVSSTTGRASTVEGLKHQYYSKPRIHRVGRYDDLFPSASFKIPFRWNIELQLNFSSTIRRPAFGDLTGSWTVNDSALTVTAPNKDLGPEKSRNFALRLAKYYEPRGVVAFNVFQNNVRGLYITNRLTEEEFGYQGSENYSGYTFITTTQSANEITLRGMELEYNQGLSFLPGPLKFLSIRGSYTRTYADAPVPLIVPHSITGGLTYSRGRLATYANYTWRDTHALTLGTTTRSYRHEGKMDIGGSYGISKGWRMYFRARDILNTPRIVLEQNGSNPQVAYGYFTNGTLWTFGGEYAF